MRQPTRDLEVSFTSLSELAIYWHQGELRRTGTLAEATVLNGAQGDCVLHCGQQMHGAQPVTRGMRVVLVCFIDELYSP